MDISGDARTVHRISHLAPYIYALVPRDGELPGLDVRRDVASPFKLPLARFAGQKCSFFFFGFRRFEMRATKLALYSVAASF
jgi:hypothetical protein